jgi:hypothetical protein
MPIREYIGVKTQCLFVLSMYICQLMAPMVCCTMCVRVLAGVFVPCDFWRIVSLETMDALFLCVSTETTSTGDNNVNGKHEKVPIRRSSPQVHGRSTLDRVFDKSFVNLT